MTLELNKINETKDKISNINKDLKLKNKYNEDILDKIKIN